MQLVEGPFPSSRFGLSLRLMSLRAKTCSYDCVYCLSGRTHHLQRGRRTYHEPAEVVAAVLRRIDVERRAGRRVEAVVFGADGEPTLDRTLEPKIRQLRSFDLEVGVMTNGSLLWQEDVAVALATADRVSLKVDTADEAVWKQLNRPHGGLRLERVVAGLRAFAEGFAGELMTETMLVAGVNDDAEGIERTAELVGAIAPTTAWLSIPTHPPAETWVVPPAAERLEAAEIAMLRHTGTARWLSPPDRSDVSGAGTALVAELRPPPHPN